MQSDGTDMPPRRASGWGGLLAGAVAGVALVALVAGGWMLGARGPASEAAAPAPTTAAPPSAATVAMPGASGESPHGQIEATDSPVVAQLRLDLAAAPERLDLRRRLALELLRQGDFYGAFAESERILERAPNDVEGLFVQGAVRVRMGQPSQALPLLDRVLEQLPDHVGALTAKGKALARAGHADQAEALWRRALELAGGSDPQIEELLRTGGE